MSQEDAERARSAYEGMEAFFALFADDIEVDWTAYPLPDFGGVVRGRKAAIEAHLRYWGAFDPTSYRVEPAEVVDAGERIVILTREEGTGRQSGVHLKRSFASVWTFRDGKIMRIEIYETLEKALEAAGVADRG